MSLWPSCARVVSRISLGIPLVLGTAQAAEIALSTPGSSRWQPLVFRGVPSHTDYTLGFFEGADSVRTESNCSASGLVLPLESIHLDQTPMLSWRWRVDRGLDIPNEQAKAGDDFAARVYVMFRLDDSRASAFVRLRHRLAKLFYGENIPGSALNFVWTSRLPRGTVWDNPFEANAKMTALEQGAKTGWRAETVDVAARYRELFRTPAPPLLGLAIMSDSDNSCQRTRAYFADFKFLSMPVAGAKHGE